ncbi:pre-piRNA 3'-exonuclease trimmer [Halictus rubicundus]|uniref:pre-piRNA 3'-exonuclease trimmer n=1 Tax=Halictus rubicundus TaxID=77578 RepID=UPI0040353EF8
MNEVVDQNFEELYPDIENSIKNASFISIDSEFSGLQSFDHEQKYSLFDSLDDRYKLLRQTMEPFIIIQCGIAAFQHIPNENVYKGQCYNFYLLPRSVPFKNRKFSFQVSALEFLSIHNFDFNKCIHNGISFLDQIDEEILKEHLEKGNLDNNLENLSHHEEYELKECKQIVYHWLTYNPNEISLKLATSSPILQYMIHKELRNTFKNIWTMSGYKSVIIIRTSQDMRKVYELDNTLALKKALLDSYTGFSKVFKLLTSVEKPIIGHNMLLDLILMHQQFYKPLPQKYSEFKSNIHSLFPHLYDTKFMSQEFKKGFTKKEVYWKMNTLSGVYQYFKSIQGNHLAFNSPEIKMNGTCNEEEAYHTAGWDAYITGYIFVRMGHALSIQKYGEGLEKRAVTHSEIMSSVKHLVNSVNVARSNEIYTKLDGNDPTHTRPQWLHVKLNSSSLNLEQIADKFATFGAVDVMPYTRKRVLVAVLNHRSADDILSHFQNSKEIQVARYSSIRHAHPKKIVLWSSLILTSGVVAWVIRRVFKNVPD